MIALCIGFVLAGVHATVGQPADSKVTAITSDRLDKIFRDNSEKLVSYNCAGSSARIDKKLVSVPRRYIGILGLWQDIQINLVKTRPRHIRAHLGRMTGLLCLAMTGPTPLRPDFRPNWLFLLQKDFLLSRCSMLCPLHRGRFGQLISY